MKNAFVTVLCKVILSIFIWVILSISFSLLLKDLRVGCTAFATSISFMATSLLMNLFFEKNDSKNIKVSLYKNLRSFGNGLLIGIWIPLLSVIILLLLNLVELKINEFQLASIPIVILLLLFTAVGEEFFFRGYVYGVFTKFSTSAAIASNSVLFSVAYLINPNSFSKPIQYLIIEMVNILLFGFLFSLVRFYTKQIWSAIGIHFMVNVLQSVMFGFLNGGKQVVSFTTASIIKGNVWNGYNYGIESSLILTTILLITISLVILHYHNIKKNGFQNFQSNLFKTVISLTSKNKSETRVLHYLK